MTLLIFVPAMIGGAVLGIAGNTARRTKNNLFVILIGTSAALTIITLMLSSSYPDWSSPAHPFLLGLVVGTLLPDRVFLALDRLSSH